MLHIVVPVQGLEAKKDKMKEHGILLTHREVSYVAKHRLQVIHDLSAWLQKLPMLSHATHSPFDKHLSDAWRMDLLYCDDCVLGIGFCNKFLLYISIRINLQLRSNSLTVLIGLGAWEVHPAGIPSKLLDFATSPSKSLYDIINPIAQIMSADDVVEALNEDIKA